MDSEVTRVEPYYIQPGTTFVTPKGPDPGKFIVYGLAGKDGRVRYVGKSAHPRSRLISWRHQLGFEVEMIVLQRCVSKAAMDQQEKVWIKKLQGTELWNIKEVDPIHQKQKDSVHPFAISIRNVNLNTWQKFRRKAKAERENPGVLLTELLQLYLNNQIKINRQVLITSSPEISSEHPR